MVLQNYQNVIEMTSNMIYIVALGIGLKCSRKIHLNTQSLYIYIWIGFFGGGVHFGVCILGLVDFRYVKVKSSDKKKQDVLIFL